MKTPRRVASAPAPVAAGVPDATKPAEPAGLKKLEGRSELERAILYAEILGPPKALRD